jgi:glycosyltransferase involved in cell wall biosynthesis
MDFNDFKSKYEILPVEEFPHQVSDKPIVSVCVLTYQHKPYIKECLDGILMQQTNFPFEILIGEDSSTDGTREICIEYAEKYPNKIRLFLHHRENNIKINDSPTGRFNLLYSFFIARGKYIALCEGDDYWTDPYKLQKQCDFLEANEDFSICFTYSQKVDEVGNPIESIPELKKSIYTQYNFLIGKKFQTRTATVLFRKQNIDFNEINNSRINNGDTWIRIIATKDSKGILLPFFSACYRIHSAGIWSSISSHVKYKKAYQDWLIKLNYAFKYNKKAIFMILMKFLKSYAYYLVLKIKRTK